MIPTLISKERDGGKNKAKMITLPDPSLHVKQVHGAARQQLFPKTRKLSATFVRDVKGGRDGVNPKSQMNHVLSWEDCTFRRRNIVAQTHGNVDEGIHRTSRAGTERVLKRKNQREGARPKKRSSIHNSV